MGTHWRHCIAACTIHENGIGFIPGAVFVLECAKGRFRMVTGRLAT